MSAARPQRLDEIAHHTASFDIVALTGTQRHKGEDKIEAFLRRDTGKLIVESGWERAGERIDRQESP